MSLLDEKEFKTPVPMINIGAIVLAVLAGVSLGFFTGKNITAAEYQDRIQENNHHFAMEEVGGVRSDMDKEDAYHREQLKELRQEIEDLKKQH